MDISLKGRTSSPNTEQQEYFNFINSLNAEHTRKTYAYCLSQFLGHCKLDLHSFLIDPQKENIIIQYLVEKKVSGQYKNVILATIRHACDMNNVLLNWKRIKKFIRTSQKTGNEIAGKDRGYTHQEIEKILSYSDQRIKTAFLILTSTGMRIGGLGSLKYGDLERIQDLYKVTVYSGEKEQYITFTTPEAAKEIDNYLEFRKRKGEHITSDSYLIVKRLAESAKGMAFKGYSLRSILQDTIERTGIKTIGSKWKRKETPLLHAFRKFFRTQLQESKVDTAIAEMLMGHRLGLIGIYSKPSIEHMLEQYYLAVPKLTISNEERLKFKLEERIQIQKTQYESLSQEMNEFKKELAAMKKSN